jgi:2-oxoglutarate ferredoxin oxidoreductase subunit beta
MNVTDIVNPANLVYKKNSVLNDLPMHYCPGCSHGVVHKLLGDIIEELDIQDKTIGVAPVGCAVFAYKYLDIDWQQAAHGRAPALATAIKRLLPDRYVFTYQGDGDLAAIGSAETLHACNRGENIVIIYINNGIYGMTGGQMAPTTLLGMKSTTSPQGRLYERDGNPLDMSKLVAELDGVCYVTRQAVHTVGAVKKCRRAIRKAFEYSALNRGTSIVEVVSTCNSGWKMTPDGANKWMVENMFPQYPLGDIKDTIQTEKK